MTRDEARIRLRKLLMSKKSIALTAHARERMIERKFTMQDVMRALIGGVIAEDPKETKNFKGFECKMRTKLDDGRILEVPIVVVEDNRRIIVKTTRRVSK